MPRTSWRATWTTGAWPASSRGDEPGIHGAGPPGASLSGESPLESISAITLGVHDMARSVRFYEQLGFLLHFGGEQSGFSSFAAGGSHLNLVIVASETTIGWWGRVIFYVRDVDELYQRACAAGLRPETAPADASWGERYFHILDPDGHELSFAKRL
ncbi:MAG: VOC family protein [Dehalococcoidia bacterium]|nr:VOC family protein [Dehalococcoidia bacterium]